MNISQEGIDMIKSFESFSPTPYKDIRGRWTIGWGHAIGVDANTLPISQMQGEGLLWDDLETAEKVIIDLVKIDLTQCEFDALTSFVFNEGQGRFQKSTMLQKLNLGDRPGAAKEFDRWIYYTDEKTGEKKVSEDLQKRREMEKQLFLEDFNEVRNMEV